MDIVTVLSFVGASALLSLIPGPDNIFVITESITKGYKQGIAISIGLCFGTLIHTIAVATGVSLILRDSTLGFNIIKYFGASYLLFLAYKTYKEEPREMLIIKEKSSDNINIVSLIRKGLLMNLLNPKVSLFFIAFLPQFVDKDGFNTTLQMFFLGFIFMLQSLIIFSSISILSGSLAYKINNKCFWVSSKFISVFILFGLGIFLIFSQS